LLLICVCIWFQFGSISRVDEALIAALRIVSVDTVWDELFIGEAYWSVA